MAKTPSQPIDELKKTISIPDRTSSKRNLEGERNDLNNELNHQRKKLKPKASFDAQFWSQAARVEHLTIKRTEIHKKISLRDFIRDGGSEAEWEHSDQARDLFQQIHAQQMTAKICEGQEKKLNEDQEQRSLRASFMKLFTTSKMGLGIIDVGVGKRDPDQQTKFRLDAIDAYNSRYPGEEPWLWCPIMRDWFEDESTVAGHIFAHMHGQAMMDAIFGKTATPELFSPKNGLIISNTIEKVFDTGFLVIVPLLSERPCKTDLAKWMMGTPREYQIRIIDDTAKIYNQRIRPNSDLCWKDLDGRPLVFRSKFRPSARYLYFHYCLQILRRAWKLPLAQTKVSMRKEIGKLYWGTPGRYLPRNMLRAFVEELGHEYEQLLEGAASSTGDDEALLAASSAQVKGGSFVDSGMSIDSECDEEDDDDVMK